MPSSANPGAANPTPAKTGAAKPGAAKTSGLINPVAVPVKILAFVIWLFGLIAVAALWQAASTAYFKAPRP
jgi:hypothetical protein